MAPPRAYLLSLLAVRRMAEKDAFTKSFPHPFLVWEPGAWQPAAKGAGPEPAKTIIVSAKSMPTKPTAGDALCFQLSERRAYKLGRATTCDIVLNDATVSREHVVLEPDAAGGWTIHTAPGSSAPAALNGRPLGTLGTPFGTKAQLKLGDVSLTLLDMPALAERLDAQIRQLSTPAPRK